MDKNGTVPGIFFTASLSKSFTALAVMHLADAGRVDVDESIQSYLPELAVADAAVGGDRAAAPCWA
jgi:CubicO group peptidase (beta-lactamase class C family)